MKILHITYNMQIGGTEMVIKNLIEGNDDTSIKMSIFCIEAPLGPWGVELKKTGTPVTMHERQPGFDILLIKTIRKYIKQHNIDVLHCHQYTPWVYGVLAASLTKTKVIFTEHGRFYPDSSSWKRRFINPILIMMTNSITAISQATKVALDEFEFIPLKKVEVIYNGIAPLTVNPNITRDLKVSLNISTGKRILGTVARLDPIKNQKLMIRAFHMVLITMPNLHLLIVGDGECREELEELALSLGIAKQISFVGYKSDPRVYLDAMDIFLLSSLSEGTSITLLEAMSLGKPCVVTDAGGNAEIIKDNINGVVTKNGDIESFANGIKSLLSMDLSEISHESVLRFNEMFTSQKMNSKYKALYQRDAH